MNALDETPVTADASAVTMSLADGAVGPIGAFSAEYLTALSFAFSGDDVWLAGGKQPMYDIATDPDYTDVKLLKPMSPAEQAKAAAETGGRVHEWELHMPANGAFPLEKETKSRGIYRKSHLGLVRLTASYTAGWDGAKLAIEVEPSCFVCSWIPTEDVNELIAPCAAMYCWLPTDWLEFYPAFTLPAGRPGPTHTVRPAHRH